MDRIHEIHESKTNVENKRAKRWVSNDKIMLQLIYFDLRLSNPSPSLFHISQLSRIAGKSAQMKDLTDWQQN